MSRKPYSTDLTDSQWKRIKPWMPKPAKKGRPPKYTKRDIVNAIFHLTHNGCTWRGLPHDFVFHWFRAWQADGTWNLLHEKPREPVCKKTRRTPKPTAAILDSQTTKATEQGGPRGYDAEKRARPQAVCGC